MPPHHQAGWFLWPFNLSFFGNNPPDGEVALSLFFITIFGEYFLWVIFIFLLSGYVLSIFFYKLRKIFLNRELIFFIVIFISYFLFFYIGPSALRYLLFIYPLIIIIFCNTVINIFKRNLFYISIFFLVCFIVPRRVSFISERNIFTILADTNIYVKTTQYLEENLSKKDVLLTYFPISSFVNNSFYGYVDSEIGTLTCENYLDSVSETNIGNLLLVTPINNFISISCKGIGNFELTKKISKETRRNERSVKIYKLDEDNEKRID
jgi:hypothetical protein